MGRVINYIINYKINRNCLLLLNLEAINLGFTRSMLIRTILALRRLLFTNDDRSFGDEGAIEVHGDKILYCFHKSEQNSKFGNPFIAKKNENIRDNYLFTKPLQ